jgi:hypothetical protein
MLAKYCTCRHCVLCKSFEVNCPGVAVKAVCFWVNRVDGVRISGASRSLDTGIRGLLLTIAVISAIKVESTSCVSLLDGSSDSIESKILLSQFQSSFPISHRHVMSAED